MADINIAKRDPNRVTAMLFVGSDGLTYNAEGDENTGRLYVDLAGGSGTVTSVSVVSANGFAGTVANATTTPAITLTTTVNSPVLAGNGTAISAATTTGSTSTVVLQTSPTLITPVLGVATATSINGLTITSSTGTLTITNGKTLTQSNTLTYTGTDGSSVNFGTGGTVLYTASAIPLTVGTTTIASGTDTRILYDNAGVLGEYPIGTGVATALAVNVGSAGAFVTFDGALGTPSSGTVTNLTGTASININGTVGATTPTTGVFTTLVAGSTTSLLLGTAGSAVGNIGFRNATSGTITLAPTTGALGTVTLTLPAVTDTIAALAATQTFTNKRITKRVVTAANDATAVIDGDITDDYYLTAMSEATEISVTGTPTTGQTIFIGLKDDGTGRALTWTGITALGVTLPTTTVANKQHIIGIKYISAAWWAIAVGVQA